ncbi:LacI family transcriptional regulator [Clostridium sp. SHJSY1]|uniref:LacI family DNA-binding transcriptional regulator n=1 Tax=Clostridium sp. SHJSY1 TaxID=2942483 RepID=UPI002876D843|nr:LacI family DNA-binding transcriptional regulator [Clostridium sp. SHJSY1]MDS0526945.1 LacI family transcriptional regulator [Clostridium sp. SHJSY1]
MNIKDIAKLSGVGVSTVSRVLNNHVDVKESTRQKVLEVIKKSNYIPNNSARILKQNNTNNIGVLVKGVFNPFFSEMVSVIGKIISKSKYTMVLQQNDFTLGDDFETLQSFIKEKRLQGVICLGVNFESVSKDSINSLDVPVVLTSANFKLDEASYSSVGIDNVDSAYKATNYLIELGHKNIAVMIGEENDIGISWTRLKGYKMALEEAGISFNQDNMLVGDYSYEKAYKVMREFLIKNKNITAIFSISDIMAVGVAKAIVDSGLRIGEDISLVGFDGLEISKFYNPGITTMKQPKVKMAKQSINLLLDLLNGKGNHAHVILNTELIKRESCKKLERG